jgi:hypothetical protein
MTTTHCQPRQLMLLLLLHRVPLRLDSPVLTQTVWAPQLDPPAGASVFFPPEALGEVVAYEQSYQSD